MISRSPLVLVRRVVALLVVATMLDACGSKGAAVRHALRFRHRRPAPVWTPAALTEVRRVAIDSVKAAVTQRLAGKAPDGITDDAWKHTKALYKSFGATPLWLTTGGLEKDRARVLIDAMLSLGDDAIRVDQYPIAQLSSALTALKGDKPTAEQFAEADVLLSATYAGMGLDLLTGQITPKSVGLLPGTATTFTAAVTDSHCALRSTRWRPGWLRSWSPSALRTS